MPVNMRQHLHYWKEIVNNKFPFFTKVVVGESPDYTVIEDNAGINLYGDSKIELGDTPDIVIDPNSGIDVYGSTNRVRVGTSPNYAQIGDDYGVSLYGTTQVWNDIQNSLIGDKINSPAGTVSQNYTESTIDFAPSGSVTDSTKRVDFNIQMPHDAKVDGSLNVHVHWFQQNSTSRTWSIMYRIQKNGQAKTTPWTTISKTTVDGNIFPYTSGQLNQVTSIGSIDLTGAGLSAIVQIRLARTDAAVGNVSATFIDCHYQKDTMGSREEYSK